MPDIDEPLPLPTNPQTVADLLPHLPIPYDYGRSTAWSSARSWPTALPKCRRRTRRNTLHRLCR
jgi:hypothetical protein